MKPDEARRRRNLREAEKRARGERLEHFLRTGEPRDVVRPELIPDEDDMREAEREVRRLIRTANRTPRGTRTTALLRQLATEAIPRLIFVERVLMLDPFERAGLTPARLVVLSTLSPEDVRERMARWQGEGGAVLLPGSEDA